MKHFSWWISALVLILFLLTCAKDKPLPTGYSDIFGNREGQIADTLIVQEQGSETYYSRLINTGLGANLLIGNYQNYASAIYMKFGLLPDSAQVHSAKLYLYRSSTDSTMLTSNQTFNLNLHHSNFEWDYDGDPEQYLNQLPFTSGSFQNVIAAIDTSDTIAIDLDTLVVSDWADTTSGLPNNGFWMISDDLQGILSFYSAENGNTGLKPALKLIYTITDSTGDVRDTTTVYATDDAFLIPDTTSALNNIDPNDFYIGKGLGFRSFIKFDLSGFDTTIHINRARMEIVINQDNSIGNVLNAIDFVIFRKEEESNSKSDVNEFPATSTYGGTLVADTLIIDVTQTIQGWIGNSYPNYGFLVRSFNEERAISRTAFYSSKSSEELQPRLYLYFSTPPKQGL